MTNYLELLDEISRASIRCVEEAWQEEPPPKRDGTKMVFIPELLFDRLNSAVQRLIVTDRYNDSKNNLGKGDKQIGIYSFPKGGDYKGIDIDTIEGIDKGSTHLLKRAGYNTTGDLYNISVSCIHGIPWMGERASFTVVHKIAQAILIKMGIDTVWNSKVILASERIQDKISEEVTAQMIVDRVIKNESEVNITPEEFEKNEHYRLIDTIVDCCVMCKYIEIDQYDAFLNCLRYNNKHQVKMVDFNGLCDEFQHRENSSQKGRL